MTTAQVFQTSVTVNNNSPIEDYVHSYDHTQPADEMTPRFKPFTILFMLILKEHAMGIFKKKPDKSKKASTRFVL